MLMAKEASFNNIVKLLEIKVKVGHKETLEGLVKEIRNGLKISIHDCGYNYVPLLVRAGLDLGISNPNELKDAYIFIKLAILLFELAITNQYDKAIKVLSDIEKTNFYQKHEKYEILEPFDKVTEYWSHPILVADLAKHLVDKLKTKNVILVNFAHGSTRAALLLSLLLKLNGFNVMHIPVRFSVRKMGDKKFRFSMPAGEKRIAKLLKKGYVLLVVDEDVSSGMTFKNAWVYLSKVFREHIEKIKTAAIMECIFPEDVEENVYIVDIKAYKVYNLLEEKRLKGFIECTYVPVILKSLAPSQIKRTDNKELMNIVINNDLLYKILKDDKQVISTFNKIKNNEDVFNKWKSKILNKEEIKKLLQNL